MELRPPHCNPALSNPGREPAHDPYRTNSERRHGASAVEGSPA